MSRSAPRSPHHSRRDAGGHPWTDPRPTLFSSNDILMTIRPNRGHGVLNDIADGSSMAPGAPRPAGSSRAPAGVLYDDAPAGGMTIACITLADACACDTIL